MKTLKYLLLILSVSFLFNACSKDIEPIKAPFVIAFKEKSIPFNQIKKSHTIQMVFSEQPTVSGSVIIKPQEENMTYGVDYKTIPELKNGMIKVPFTSGAQKLEFTYINLIIPASNKRKLSFMIDKINYENALIQGNTTLVLSFEESLGGEFTPTIGGGNEPNQVFVDLSSKTEKVVKRDTWSLGFYSGDTFNVVLNETNYAATGAIDATDIDSVTEADFQSIKSHITVFSYESEDGKYADDPERDFSKNAIKPIEMNANDNKVYLLNLGHQIPNTKPKTGNVNTAGKSLGWRKIRILRKDKGYLLQYAKLNDTSHKEIFIPKSKTGYAFTYFNFITEKIVSVAPRMQDWDISFSVFTNKFPNGMSYGYSDFVMSNKLGGVKIYSVKETTTLKYGSFKLTDVDKTKLISKRTAPGSSWRNVFKKIVTEKLFYIIKDPDGNIYKLQFLQLVNEKGERGNIKFVYTLLK